MKEPRIISPNDSADNPRDPIKFRCLFLRKPNQATLAIVTAATEKQQPLATKDSFLFRVAETDLALPPRGEARSDFYPFLPVPADYYFSLPFAKCTCVRFILQGKTGLEELGTRLYPRGGHRLPREMPRWFSLSFSPLSNSLPLFLSVYSFPLIRSFVPTERYSAAVVATREWKHRGTSVSLIHGFYVSVSFSLSLSLSFYLETIAAHYRGTKWRNVSDTSFPAASIKLVVARCWKIVV